MKSSNRCVVGIVVLAAVMCAVVAPSPAAALKSESFDRDPGWEGFKNRMKPEKPVIVKQDFGYSMSNHAGKQKGEIGGAVQRAMTPAYYAAKIEPTTLNDRISCSGT